MADVTKVQIKYMGARLPAATDRVVLFDSTTYPDQRSKEFWVQAAQRWTLLMFNDENVTVEGFTKSPRDTTWRKVYDSGTINAAVADTANQLDLYVGDRADLKLELLVGATDLSDFAPTMFLHSGRAVKS